MIADDNLVFDCGNVMEKACKDHDNNLLGLLERARMIGLRFNSAKRRLQYEKLRYLGHLISSDGLKLDPRKVAAIKKMRKPTDIKFLSNLSTICDPLRKFSCKDASWQFAIRN